MQKFSLKPPNKIVGPYNIIDLYSLHSILPYTMAHTIKDKKKIITRVNRIKGQLDALSKAVEAEDDCYKIMQLLASSRGAINGLMGDLVEGHIKDHIVIAPTKQAAAQAGDELIELMGSFWK